MRDKDKKKKLHILEVCFSRSQGGLEMYMANISRFMAKRDHRIWTIASAGSYLQNKLSNSAIPFKPITPKRRYLDFRIANKIAEIIVKNRIDIIHAHQSADLSTLILAKKKAQRGKLVFTQQMESRRKKKDVFHRLVYRNVDGLVAITDRIKNQVSQNTMLFPNRLFRLYYGIDLEKFKPNLQRRETSRRRFGILPGEIAIGIVGRLEEGKGQHILLQAVGQLTNYLPKIKVIFIGAETVGQTGYLDYLKKSAEDLGISSRTIFTGFQEDVPSVSAALDIVVLATRKETFGLSLIECMAQQIAPIGTNAGGVPEIIQDGLNGLLVKPFDTVELSAALNRLINNSDLQERLAANARQTVVEKFNLQDHLNGLEKIFYQVCAG